ncbi:MAG: hypothetical protein R3E66_13060 [bacterium]
MRRGIHIWVLASLLVASSPGFAQDPHGDRAEAEQHYQTAVVLLSEGRFLEALNEFDAAIALSPQAIFYCNRALALVKLKETTQAVQSLKSCRDNFEGDAAELAQIDAQYLGVAAFDQVIRPHSMTIAQDIASGPIVRPSQDDDWNLGDFGLISMGVGAAFLASAVTLDLLSADLHDSFIAESEGGAGTSQARYDELKSDLEFRQTVFWSLAGAGTLFVVVGGGLVAYHLSSDDDSISWIPTASTDGFGVQIRSNF